ncbi:MAG: hypothetical protein HZC01_05290 [Candidatus Kerfeldbacteria bacterium]|nr:hypothetical protein [Candidatus Kerfeldbacteria bacterium]
MNLQELLVTLIIVVIIFSIVFASYLTYINVYKVQLVRNTLSTELSRIFAVSTKSVRGATEVVASLTIGGNTYTTGSHTVIVKSPAIDANDLIVNNAYDYFILTSPVGTPNSLVMITEADPASARSSTTTTLTTHLSSLQINYDSETTVDISRVELILSLSQFAANRTITNTGQSTIFLRNSP